MIHIEGLKVKFKDFVALDIDQEIHIEKGDKVGVIGSNGAGKSTLMRSILDLVPFEGSIIKSVDSDRISFHSQQTAYIEGMKIKVIMEMILDAPIQSNPKVQKLIKHFDFEKCLSRKWSQLSGGEKQKFTLILVLSQDNPITILDEVTSGLDFVTRTNLMDLLKKWYEDKDNTLILISHYYDEIEPLVNKILYLDSGKILAFGDRRELFTKYCGYSILVFEDREVVKEVLKPFRKLPSKVGKIVVSCMNDQEEKEVLEAVSPFNVNYRRSNEDIEFLSLAIKEGKKVED